MIVPLRWGGKGKASGIEIEERGETWLFRVTDRRIVRVTEFATRDAALRAAGLSD